MTPHEKLAKAMRDMDRNRRLIAAGEIRSAKPKLPRRRKSRR